MSTNIEIFKNEEFGTVRTLLFGEEPWFVGKDVARALGYSNPQKAIRDHVEGDDRGVNEMDTPSGKQNIVIINESGLYALIFGSKLESAKRFKKWVTSEVLPAIRKTGTYSIEKKLEQKEKLISARDLAAMLKRKHCKVCYRIDSLVRQHPEYRPEFFRVFFQNSQGRMFRTYEMTEQGLRIFVALLERDGNRNSINTVNGLNQIRSRYPALADQSSTKVSLCPRTGLKELQKAEAALEMFEQCYLGMNFADFDDEDRERFDAALCLLHDQVKFAVKEAKGVSLI